MSKSITISSGDDTPTIQPEDHPEFRVNLVDVIREHFLLDVAYDHMVAVAIPVGQATYATIFMTPSDDLYVYIDGQGDLLLADVRKLVSRMGLVADEYLPPHGNPAYFDNIGREKFRAMFPGSEVVGDDDIRYYRTLAPYLPALVKVKAVRTGEIYQHDPDGTRRVAAHLVYPRP